MLEAYREHTRERGQQGIPPLALNAAQVAELVELVKNPPADEEAYILDLLTNNVPPGVDDAAYVKAAFLADVAKGNAASPILDRKRATELLGTMVGGYNIESLVALLDDAELAETAATALRGTLLMFDAFHDVAEKAKGGNAHLGLWSVKLFSESLEKLIEVLPVHGCMGCVVAILVSLPPQKAGHLVLRCVRVILAQVLEYVLGPGNVAQVL